MNYTPSTNDGIPESIQRKLHCLFNEYQIVSGEIGLLRVGGIAAFDAEGMTDGNRLLNVITNVYPNHFETEIHLSKYENGSTFFIAKDRLKPLKSVSECIRVVSEIRQSMNSGLSYLDAIAVFK